MGVVLTVVLAIVSEVGLGTSDPVVLAPGLVALVCALLLQGLSYHVFAEDWRPPYEDRRPPYAVPWHNPYTDE